MGDKVSKPAAPLEVSMEKEPSSPLRASSMDGRKQPPPPPAVVVDVHAELSPPPPVSTVSTAASASMDKKEKPPVVVLVCLWALLNAVVFTASNIADLIMNRNVQSTWFPRCMELTAAAAAAEASSLVRGELWCAAPQAAGAALALALVGRGRSRSGAGALAFVALVATGVSHYMEGKVDRIFLAAAPGDAYIAFGVAMCWVLAVFDLICLLCLEIFTLGDGGGEE